jgi:hypothetical protein
VREPRDAILIPIVTVSLVVSLDRTSPKLPKSTRSPHQRTGPVVGVATLCRKRGRTRSIELLPQEFRPTKMVRGRIRTGPELTSDRKFLTQYASSINYLTGTRFGTA